MPFMANLADQTFVDDLGRRVYLSKAPRRIVSLAPSVTEILFAVGLDAEVVGVTTFCDYPAQAKTRPKIGAAIPNLEAILGLKPDLVVAGDNGPPEGSGSHPVPGRGRGGHPGGRAAVLAPVAEPLGRVPQSASSDQRRTDQSPRPAGDRRDGADGALSPS